MESAEAVGDATAALPVISTLSFGFAAAELLAMSDESTNYGIVIVLLGLSAFRRATRLCFTSWKRETR